MFLLKNSLLQLFDPPPNPLLHTIHAPAPHYNGLKLVPTRKIHLKSPHQPLTRLATASC